jgi:hypothetical protein
LLESIKKLPYGEKVVYGAASVIALMLIFPPTKKYSGWPERLTESYDCIFSLQENAFVNIQLLLVQWLAVGIVAALLYFASFKHYRS